MMKYRYYCSFLIIFLSLTVWSQQRPHITNINRDIYKAANKNWSVAQDERGIMYFGNDIGLLESDGMDWQLHRIPNSPIIRAVAASSYNTIFTGGFEELGRWDRDISGTLKYTSFKPLVKEKSLQNENVWKVWVDNDKVYFQSFSSIYIYDSENETINTLNLSNGFLFLIKVRDEFWVQEIFGALYTLKNDALHKVKESDFFAGTTIRVILPYDKDNYLIGTSSGEVYVYDGSKFILWNKNLSSQLQGKELNNGLYSSERNTYYLGTQLDGLYEVDHQGNIISHFSTQNSLQNNTILSLYEDNRSNIWVAMDRGLAYLSYTKGLSYYKANERDAGAVYDAVFWNNNLLLGTNQGVYYASIDKLKEQNFFSYLKLIEGTQGQVWTFSKIEDKLYCGHNNNLLEIGTGMTAKSVYNLNTGVFHIIEATIKETDLLLVVTYKDLVIIEKATGKVIDMKQINTPITNVEVDHLENIWVETVSHGVYKCRYDSDTHTIRYYTYYGYEVDNELPVKLKLYKSGGRILFLGDDKFWVYDENADNLILNPHLNKCFKDITDLKRIVHIGNEQAWAVTGSCIYRFFYDGYLANILEAYKIDNSNLSLINAYENIAVLDDSISMICLDAGFILNSFNGAVDQHPELSIPYIKSIHAGNNNKPATYFTTDAAPVISYNNNDVTIYFTVNNAFASGLYIQYKLTGVDDGWSEPVRTNNVSYDRLPKGTYTFDLRTIDGLGHYSEPVSFSFRILPPWYQTVWAYILYIFIIISILYIVWLMVLRRYRNIHLRKIRARETQHLRNVNEKLVQEIEEKDAEIFTQTSFIIQKNELILKLKSMVDEFYSHNSQRSLLPLYQKMNTLLNSNMDAEEDWKMFLIKFEQKHKGFFKRLKEMHPQLTNNDLRLCACLKLNLDTKDIASLMNLSVRAVENNRYRLRKKINLLPSQNLNDYFLQFE